jgi:hypothetical protein
MEGGKREREMETQVVAQDPINRPTIAMIVDPDAAG